jgi:hypothetical protein
MVAVGDCEWHESFAGDLRHQAKLLVAEALVTPDLSSRKAFPSIESGISRQGTPPSSQLDHIIFQDQTKNSEHTEQLRITLTGPVCILSLLTMNICREPAVFLWKFIRIQH